MLSKIFSVSVDVLLKDELELNLVKEVHTCGLAQNSDLGNGLYEGVLIKESIDNESILDYIEINKVEIWKTNDITRYWTVIYFSSNNPSFPEKLSKVMIARDEGGNWFCDFKTGNTKRIVFRNKILKYEVGNREQKEEVIEECRKLGIPDEQMNWSE